MDPLPFQPRTFRDVVEADLRRAGRLIVRVQDQLDPQVRVGTPSGDLALAVTLPADDKGRLELLSALAVFMAWKEAACLTFTSELHEPDAIWCCGISRTERHACLVPIRRHPKPWDSSSFGEVEWLPADSIDPAIAGLLPASPQPLTPAMVSEMTRWFGRKGRFPAVNLTTGEIGA